MGTFNGTQIKISTPEGIALACLLLLFFSLNYAGVNILGKIS